jgi:phage terminase large subunit
MIYSRHEDNPRIYDADGEITAYGRDYIARLDNLTGVRKERLRWSRWAAAEGMIYEDWRPDFHLSDRKILPLDWPRVWAVDFGYTNPFVWQMWAVDPDGRMYLEREIYHTKRLVEDHVKQILDVVTTTDKKTGAVTWKYPRPLAVVCDHDAEDRATFERHAGIGTVPAMKNVKVGIEATQVRLRDAGDGMPRMFVCRDSLVERDPELKESGKPTCFAEEIEGYVWKPGPDGRPVPDEPLKLNDHAMDAARYVVAYQDLQPRARVRFIN